MSRGAAIYAGTVIHARHRPKRHRLRYDVFSLLVDIDALPALDRRLRLLGHNRRALFSVYDSDHGLGQIGAVKLFVAGLLDEAGLAVADLKVEMLCYPRILGYVFNPLTVYFCRDGERLVAVLYEVCNTFHERHTYVVPVHAGPGETLRHRAEKRMYVSPFVPMACSYRFSVKPPDERVTVDIAEHDAEGLLLFARFAGKRRELNDRELFKAFLTYPLMTLKVTIAIHLEALRLWMKGLPVHRHGKGGEAVSASLVDAGGQRMIALPKGLT